MMRFKNLTIIGTSHIAKESIQEVIRTIESEKPEIVALELDMKRFQAMMGPKRKLTIKDIKHLGVKGWVINVIGAWAEEKMGKIVGVKPGTEMKTAALLAAKQKARIALIDQDITITLKKLTKRITWKEKFRFISDILSAAVLRKKPEINFDLSKVPSQEVIDNLIGQVKKRYPNVYDVLIHERDVHMAKALNKLINTEQDKRIVAIVGVGHEESIINHIKRVKASDSLQKKR